MFSVLQTELQSPVYAGRNDQQAAAAVNARSVRAPVALADWSHWPYEDATYFRLTQAAAAALPSAAEANFAAALEVKAAATTMLGYITNPKILHIDMDMPATRAVIGTLLAAGVIVQDFVNRVDALANIPWWRSVGLPRPVTAFDVRNARMK